ncbi:MAG: hypothetical protein ABSE76_03315 [Minisyncoccia bacterium]|jgi:DNA transposition AAA+ family ATPase
MKIIIHTSNELTKFRLSREAERLYPEDEILFTGTLDELEKVLDAHCRGVVRIFLAGARLDVSEARTHIERARGVPA